MKMEKNKVSIIIPVYNVEKYLEKCLNSIINQTYKNIEIICINDGSTDNSLQILENFATKDKRIIIFSQENGGLSSARNLGLNNTTGEFCYFMDSDDWIELDTIENLLNTMLSNDVDCVVHNIRIIPEEESLINITIDDRKWINFYTKPSGFYKTPLDIKQEICAVTWNKLYKMSIINKYNCRFPEGLINEDEAFLWEYMIHCDNYYFINKPFYNYLKRSNSIMTTRINSLKILDILKVQKVIYKTIEQNNLIEKYKDAITKNYVSETYNLYKYLPEKYNKEALKLIKDYICTTNNDFRIIKLYIKYKYPKFYCFTRKITSLFKACDKKQNF